MATRRSFLRSLPFVFWSLTVLSLLIWSLVPGYTVGWDVNVYRNAILSLRAGRDPYLDGIAVQKVFHQTLALHPYESPPYTYVYSPVTLLPLRLIAAIPLWVSGAVYWVAYVAAAVAALYVGVWAVEQDERAVFALLAAVAIFFPGLLQNDVFFSGNIACILYGCVLLTAWRGWRGHGWGWFYPVVLAASCIKAPLLSLLAIPVLSATRQGVRAAVTAGAGVLFFVVQPHLWPGLFHHYLQAVELQFSFNQDFGSSPAGLLANALYYRMPYQVTSTVFYLCYALLFAVILLALRRRFLAGYLTVRQWVPLMLVGVILLNPRIMQYDVAPLALPMALVLWRACTRLRAWVRPSVAAAAVFTCGNLLAIHAWHLAECLMLVGLFLAGAWTLWQQSREAEQWRGVVAEGTVLS